MYNRYIPQPDGSYRRNRVPDMAGESPRPMPPREEPRRNPEPCPPEQEAPPCRNGQPWGQMRGSCRPSPPPRPNPQQQAQNSQPRRDTGVGGFLRQLLPKDFSTEDLLVVLLLLLMAGDCQEDQNSALLTLALYLFL